MICTDSSVALNAFYSGLQHQFLLMVPEFDVDSLLNSSVCLKLVPSELNDLADNSTANGLNRLEIFYNWASHWSI